MRLTETLAEELKEKNINVNAVLPTIIDTPANRGAMPDADPATWVAPADLANVIASCRPRLPGRYTVRLCPSGG